MFRICDQFTNHSLNHADIAIKYSTKDSSEESHPKAGGKTNYKEGGKRTATTHE